MSSRQEVKWSLRQNMWKKHKGVFNTVEHTRKIVCSGYHTKERSQVDILGNPIINPDNIRGNMYITKVQEGDLAILFETGNNREAMLVRITSQPYKTILEDVSVYKKNNEVVLVCLTADETHQPDYDTREVMHAIVRDIEIVGRISGDASIFKKYKTLATSIAQNRSDARFV
jgi:hypothetical protein